MPSTLPWLFAVCLALALSACETTREAGDLFGLPERDVVEAVDREGYATFASALRATGLNEELREAPVVTIFAPSDEAFLALPEASLVDLMRPDNRERLTRILRLHVVEGRATADDLVGRSFAVGTLAGLPIAIDATGETLRVERAEVVETDILAANGVVHGIDRVLLPQDARTPEPPLTQ